MELSRIGPYRLERPLGAGGMGEVFEAYDERLHRRVALKLIRPDRRGDSALRERLRCEARASARLNHPGIVQIYDILQTDDADCIVMELVCGQTLAQRMRSGPLDLADTLALAKEIADALAEAHALGIVHRDLKSENIILTPAGRAKVMDFGIAKLLDVETAGALTATGNIIGTCRAMSPEQAQGRAVEPRSDLFSLGTLLYEMVTGRSPFLADNNATTLLRICHYRHKPAREENPQVPEPLSALIDRLLAKEPEQRPASAREVAAAIEKIRLVLAERTLASAGAGEIATTLAATLVAPPPTPHSFTGERRQVTLMRCGLVRPDGGPPDLEDLLAATAWLQSAAAEAVRRHECSLGQATADGVQLLFGYPRAREDDARRAVHAALFLGAQAASDRPRGLGLQVGIHTGPMVVARAPGGQEELALGETAVLAAAVQSLAEPGAIVLSGATHQLAGAFFDCEALAPVRHPGLPLPVAGHRVLANRGTQDRIEGGPAAALTPLVARGQELELLLERWALAKEGRGQVVTVAGEAGIGKSRLVYELRQRISAEGPARLDLRCSPYSSNTPFYPVTELLWRLLRPDREIPPAEQLGRLEEMIGRYGLPLHEIVPLLAALLAVAVEGRYPPLNLSPERQRVKTLEALVALLLAIAERQPLLLVVEDLHWIDPTSLELLGLLLAQVPAMRMLGLWTHRPEFAPPWPARSYLAQLHLSPLTTRQVQQMAEHLACGKPLPAALLEQVVARTDGVPLVVEELLKMVLESGFLAADGRGDGLARQLRPLEIPATLRDSLTARLDRLGTAKEVAQLAAALGREFSFEVLAAVAPWDEEFLRGQLDRLVDAELLYRRGLPPKASYLFKHALIQEAAHASVLKSTRQLQHRRIAEALETRFPEIAQGHAELLAHHYTEAGLTEKAVAAWKRAGEAAIQSCAQHEAIGHLNRALELLAELPETVARHRDEIEVQITLGVAYFSAVPVAPEVQRAFARALSLCAEVGSTPQRLPALRGKFTFEFTSGLMGQAETTARELLDLAEREGDPMLLLVAHQGLGFALMMQGRLPAAVVQLKASIAYLDHARSRPPLLIPGAGDPAAECFSCLGWAHWLLGYPDEALRYGRESLDFARRPPNPRALAFAAFQMSELHGFRRELEAARQYADECGLVAAEHALSGLGLFALLLQGWVLVQQGSEEEGTTALEAATAVVRELGVNVCFPQHLALLAEVCLRTRRIEAGLATITEAFAASAAGEQRVFDSELHRLRAELLALQGAPDQEVEEALRRALDVARRQEAKSLELRAATSLARFWAARGRSAEGRDLLAGIYGWFAEGFDSGDLREARALLAELS
jgi:TOMM system kinase/cyclase fusion protein